MQTSGKPCRQCLILDRRRADTGSCIWTSQNEPFSTYRSEYSCLGVRTQRKVSKTIHSSDDHVCSGRQLFRARERKNKIVGTIAEPRKAAVWPSILRTL